MKTTSALGLIAAFSVPALICSCSQSPTDTVDETIVQFEELGKIGTQVKEGKLTEDEAAAKIDEIAKKLAELKKLTDEMEKNPDQKKIIDEYTNSEAFATRMQAAQAGIGSVFEAYSKSSNAKFKAAVENFGKTIEG